VEKVYLPDLRFDTHSGIWVPNDTRLGRMCYMPKGVDTDRLKTPPFKTGDELTFNWDGYRSEGRVYKSFLTGGECDPALVAESIENWYYDLKRLRIIVQVGRSHQALIGLDKVYTNYPEKEQWFGK
jgi:hypothetical protein